MAQSILFAMTNERTLAWPPVWTATTAARACNNQDSRAFLTDSAPPSEIQKYSPVPESAVEIKRVASGAVAATPTSARHEILLEPQVRPYVQRSW